MPVVLSDVGATQSWIQPIVSIVLWLREASKLGYAMRVDDQRLASLVA
jgi:hypothetical protein